MNKTELYPLKFKPLLKEKIWGGSNLKSVLNKNLPKGAKIGESWEISGVQGSISVVKNGFLKGNNLEELIEIYMGDLVGEGVFDTFGVEFPLLIKFIDANDILSIQVHPNDELAKKRHKAYGKTEMWYVIRAEDHAEIITGFNRKINKSVYLKHLTDKTLKNILNIENTNEGDVFFIPSGRVHAIGAGILLAEIQQTSDVTYRIYDWDRADEKGKARELHTDLALDAIDFNHYPEYKIKFQAVANKTSPVVDCRYFTTNILYFNQLTEKDYYLLDSFVIYVCIEGSFSISHENGMEDVSTGECVLIPASLNRLKIIPKKDATLLEVYIKSKN